MPNILAVLLLLAGLVDPVVGPLVGGPEPGLPSVPPEELEARLDHLANLAKARCRRLARQGSWTPADVQALLTIQLADPERFVADPAFRARVLAVLPGALDPSTPPRLRDDILHELNQVRGIDFAASEAVEAAWGAIPRRALERRLDSSAGLLFQDDAEHPLTASVYSLPSFFFSFDEAAAFLAGVRKVAPDRPLLVLTDLPLHRRLQKERAGLKLTLLETYGRPYSPWPRDPFSLVRSASGAGGAVRVLVRPNLQPGREEDASLGAELIQNLPEDLDRAWGGVGGVAWAVAPVPFHNGQVLATREAAWITLHALEPRILALLKLDRVPVESFGSPAGIDRYVAAAKTAAEELRDLYGRPVRFVHPLPEPLAAPGATDGPALMGRIGGGAGYDLDSIVTLLPPSEALVAPVALVADIAAGRDLLQKLTPEDWKALRAGYGLEPDGDTLKRALIEAQAAVTSDTGLASFLDLTADHLVREGMKVRRVPLLSVPVALLKNRGDFSHREFLITWNNVVVETRDGHLRAEGFSSLIPTGDRVARDAFAAAGAHLDLVPPLVRSIVLNGGYRCASNHVRAPQPVRVNTPLPTPGARRPQSEPPALR